MSVRPTLIALGLSFCLIAAASLAQQLSGGGASVNLTAIANGNCSGSPSIAFIGNSAGTGFSENGTANGFAFCDRSTVRMSSNGNVFNFTGGGGGGMGTDGSMVIGGVASASNADGDIFIAKRTASGNAAGAGFMKLEVVCGTNAGTAKLVAIGGTSMTPVTVIDNVGSGVTGC